MKNVLFTAILVSQFAISNVAQAYNMPEFADEASIENLIKTGELSEDQENELIDYLESNGENALIRPIAEPDALAVDEYKKFKFERDQKQDWNEIAGNLGLRKLQDDSSEQVIGKGKWAFDIIFVDKKGNRHSLAALNINEAQRPASTLKIFTAWAAFQRRTYPLATMGHMLRWSSNIEADAALRSVADNEKSFVIPANSYLKGLIGYSMSMQGRRYTIDAKVAKGCAIMIKDYVNLTDSNKFHPVNGSGLQQSDKDETVHENKVTARLQTSLLYSILRSGKYDSFKKLLAQPGGEGTLRRNFKGLRTKAKIYAKTGTLGNAKSLAGFVEIPQGTIIFSVLGDYLRGVGSPAQALSGPIENIVFLNTQYVLNNFK